MKDEWAEARNTASLHEAFFFKSVLEAAGIEAFIPDEHTFSAQPGLVNALGGVSLLVRSGDLEKAREILGSAARAEANEGHARLLREIAKRVSERSTGMLVLFTGTDREAIDTAASTLAAESGRALRRIDGGALVSTYLGETEKNLSRIFADAERSGAVLLFDEADALFGARAGEDGTSDGRRIISTLLRRKETFDGLIILVLTDAGLLGDDTSKAVDYVLAFDQA